MSTNNIMAIKKSLNSNAVNKTSAFSSLGYALSAAKSFEQVAYIVAEHSQTLFGWDAYIFDIYNEERNKVSSIAMFDTVDGTIQEFSTLKEWHDPSPIFYKVLYEGAQLLAEKDIPEDRTAFGDKTRRSQSLMFVPINNGQIHGIVSIQSYTPNAYTRRDLERFEDLAGHTLGAIERIKAENLLRASEARIRALIENSSDSFTLLDSRGHVLYLSPATTRMLGYSSEDLMGTNIFDIVHPDDRREILQLFVSNIGNPDARVGAEYRIRHKNGTWKWQDSSGVNKLFDPGINAVIISSRDITEKKRVEQELRQSEALNKSVLQALANQIAVLNQDGTILAVNDAWTKFAQENGNTSLTGAEVGCNYLDECKRAFQRGDKNAMVAYNGILSVIQSRRETFSLEYPCHSPSVNRWFTMRVTAYRSDEDRIVISHEDITDLKLKQVELRRNKTFLEKAQEIGHIGSWISDIRYNGALTWTKQTCSIFGVKEEEFDGRIDSFFALVHPDDRDAIYSASVAAIRGEATYDTEFRIIRPDGQVRWLREQADVERDDKGNPVRMIGVVQDVTEKKNAEIQLHRHAKQYRLMFENHPLPMWAFDVQSLKILGVNRSAIQKYGYSEQEFLSMTIADLRPEEEKRKLMEFLKNDQHDGYAGLWKHKTKSGEVIDVEITGHLIEYEGVSAELVMCIDVTDRLKLEQQIRVAQKMESVGRLAGGVAHDFNNILGIVLAHSSFLQKLTSTDEKLEKHYEAIETAVHRGAGIVKQLLQFSRKNESDIQRVDINQHLVEMKSLLKGTIPKSIQLEHDLTEHLPAIKIDSTQLQQVFLNLYVNACDAMPNGGVLKSITRKESLQEVSKIFPKASAKEYAVVSVTDTGTGMSEEVRQRIFDPFFTTKPEGKGTGLGLPVVYNVVTGAGGFIDVASEVGKGTTFTIYFPADGDGIEAVCTPEISSNETVHGQETILFAEDEELLGFLVETMLKEHGYKVIHASNGEEAVQLFAEKSHSIDLVVCDFGLPKLNGEGVLEKIKELKPSTKVIFTSGYIEPEIKQKLVEKGASDFISKPFQSKALLEKVKTVLK